MSLKDSVQQRMAVTDPTEKAMAAEEWRSKVADDIREAVADFPDWYVTEPEACRLRVMAGKVAVLTLTDVGSRGLCLRGDLSEETIHFGNPGDANWDKRLTDVIVAARSAWLAGKPG